MRDSKKLVAIILVIVILLSETIYFEYKVDASVETDVKNIMDRLANNESWESIRKEIGLPYGTPRFNSNDKASGFHINLALWLDSEKRIIVYGTHEIVPNNEFEKGTLIFINGTLQPGEYNADEGYYVENGVKGEWRYHGFTLEGNKYTNMNFNNDADSKRPAFKKRWIKTPWSISSFGMSISDYNDIAISSLNEIQKQKTRAWLNPGFTSFNTSEDTIADDPYNYFNVLTPSTLMSNGEVIGYHLTTNGKRWYQTLSMSMLKHNDKIQPNTATKVEILDNSYQPYNTSRPIEFKGLSSADIIVKVTSVLEDKDKIGDEINRTLYFTRKDVKNPNFSLLNEQGIFPSIADKKREDTEDASKQDYTLIAYFPFTLQDTKENRAHSKLTFKASSFFQYFGEGGTSSSTNATAEAPIKWPDQEPTFNINNYIVKDKWEQTTKSEIAYTDESIGEIEQYVYTFDRTDPGSSISEYIYFTLPAKNDDAVNENIKGFLQQYINNSSNDRKTTYNFELTQSNKYKSGKNTSTKETVTLVVNPVKSDFSILDITKKIGTSLTIDDIDYANTSAGDITKYDYTISSNNGDTKTKAFSQNQSDNTAVKAKMLEFINTYYNAVKPTELPKTLTFTLKQKITTQHNSTNECTKSFKMNVKSQAFISDFIVNRFIELDTGDSIAASIISYMNISTGDFSWAEFEVSSNNGDSNSDSFSIYPQTKNTINSSTVNTKIYNFIKPYITAADEKQLTVLKFNVSQTIINDQNPFDILTDTCTKDIAIYINPIYEATDEAPIGRTEPPEPLTIPPPVLAQPSVSIPRHALDIVAIDYSGCDSTDMSTVASRTIYVDGKITNNFFRSDYIWGDNADGFHHIKVEYVSLEGYPAEYSCWVLVHDTKPKAQFSLGGSCKENRLLTVQDTSTAGNDQYVVNLLPLRTNKNKWRFLDDGTYRRTKSISDIYKELMYKKPGTYGIELVVENDIRASAPYIVYFTILEDHQPQIVLNIWNNVLARNEELKLTYEAVSVDGDYISLEKLDIYYDEQNNSTYSRHIGTFTPTEFEQYNATNLGSYKVVVYAKESFGQTTMPEHITENEYKTNELIRYFYVDNYSPSTTLSVDIPMILPKVDVMVLTDQNLAESKISEIKGERINNSNYLRKNNTLPTYNIWDLKTYIYSTTASTSKNTNSSYPESSISYSSGGYSGTLNLSSTSDNGSWQDFGKYVTTTESTTATDTRSTGKNQPPSSISYSSGGYSGTLSLTTTSDDGKWVDNGAYKTVSDSKEVTVSRSNTVTRYYSPGGNLLNVTYSWGGTSDHPSVSYNSGGYSGTLYKTSWSSSGSSTTVTSALGHYKETEVFTGYYSGTVTGTKQVWESKWEWEPSYTGHYQGTVSKSLTVWEPNIQWVPKYTGYYDGTIYRSEKQQFTNPFSVDAKRYVIYVSDSTVNNMSDTKTITDYNDASIILIGSTAIQQQVLHTHYINNDGTDIKALVGQAVDWIIDQNELSTEHFTVLPGFSFTMTCGNFDEEGDTIAAEEFLYVHDSTYYDNPTGVEAGSIPSYSAAEGWTPEKKSLLTHTGAYTIYRRIKDQATTDPLFAEFNRISNEPYFKINVHRKPIAQADMKWKYDPVSSQYKLTFLDQSYDLDHQYSRADKGIIETMIRYKKGSGSWNYKMPTDLTWGTYTIEYYVKDVEQVWSNAYTLNVNLDTVPTASITIESDIQFKKTILRNDPTIPAGETIQITSPDKSAGPIIHSNVPITSAEIYINDSKLGNLTLSQQQSNTEYLYHTNIMEYAVPQNYADGNLTVLIKATSNVNNQYQDKTHNVAVYTPVWEDYSNGVLAAIQNPLSGVPASILLCESTSFEQGSTIGFTTSKYTDKIKVDINGIVFYLLSNGRISSSENGAGAASEIKSVTGSSRYKASGLAMTENTYTKQWSFELSAVEGYPIANGEEVDVVLTGYDRAGNWSTTSYKHNLNPRTKTVKADCYLLENFRVVLVRDLHLESYYLNTITGKYIDKPIYVSDMAVDGSSFNYGTIISSLTKGYMFEFEIDSTNFNEAADTIVIEPSFYTCDSFVRDSAERDIYWEDSSHIVHKIGEGGHSSLKNITLTAAERTITGTNSATWRGSYFIPATAWAVPKGTSLQNAKTSNLKRDIIVSFSIKAYKSNEMKFDYNTTQWSKERTRTKAPYALGDVIRYDHKKSALDDLKVIRNR